MNTPKEILNYARENLKYTSKKIEDLALLLDDQFLNAINEIIAASNKNKHIILSGMGKAGIIAMKISATLASFGIPSFFLHPAEALHGDLGRFSEGDIAFLLSNSGTTQELLSICPIIKKKNCKIISLCSDSHSPLAKLSDHCLIIGKHEEIGPLGLAPTTSTSLMLAYGDALTMCLVKIKNLTQENFAMYHPAGNLGKMLREAKNIMRSDDKICVVSPLDSCLTVIKKIAHTIGRPGAAIIIDGERNLKGIFTDGDMRNYLEYGTEFLAEPIAKYMTKNPRFIYEHDLAKDVLALLSKHKIDQVVVLTKDNKVAGLIDIQDLI